jgi:hypothetical protein
VPMVLEHAVQVLHHHMSGRLQFWPLALTIPCNIPGYFDAPGATDMVKYALHCCSRAGVGLDCHELLQATAIASGQHVWHCIMKPCPALQLSQACAIPVGTARRWPTWKVAYRPLWLP